MRISTLNKKTEFVNLFRNGNCVVFDKFVAYYCISYLPVGFSSASSDTTSDVDMHCSSLSLSTVSHATCEKKFLTILNMKCRFGFVVKKKIGNAVVRNKIRRRFKNAIPQVFLSHGGEFAKKPVVSRVSYPIETSSCSSESATAEKVVHIVFVARSKIVHSSYASILNDLKILKKKIKLE